MTAVRKTLRSIRTAASIMDRRRVRTSSGALLELSVLANEKERLNRELAAAARRRNEIVARLSEIMEKEQMLRRYVENPEMVAQVCDRLPQAREARGRVRAKEISY